MRDVKTEIRVNQEQCGVRIVQDLFIPHISKEFARYVVMEDYISAGVVAPSNQPTSLVFSSVTATGFTVSFTASVGGADVYLAIRRTSASPTYVPVDGTNYSVGDTVGDGEVRHFGAGVTFNESGLTFSTTYYYDIYAGNGATGTWVYLTTSPLEGSQATLFSFENAFSLDNINDYLDSAPTTAFVNLPQISVAVWVKITSESVGVNKIIITCRVLGASTGAMFQIAGRLDGGNLYYTFRIGNGFKGGYFSVANDNDWHLIFLEFDGGLTGDANRLKGFDGDTQKTLTFDIPGVGTTTGTFTASPVIIGSIDGTSNFFGGLIDHVAIKLGTWSAAEKTAMFNAKAGADYPAGYASHWNANSNTTDLGTLGLNLTLRNGATYAAH